MSMVAKRALRIVEEPEFRKLIEMLSNSPGYHLPTRKTLTNSLIPKFLKTSKKSAIYSSFYK